MRKSYEGSKELRWTAFDRSGQLTAEIGGKDDEEEVEARRVLSGLPEERYDGGCAVWGQMKASPRCQEDLQKADGARMINPVQVRSMELKDSELSIGPWVGGNSD